MHKPAILIYSRKLFFSENNSHTGNCEFHCFGTVCFFLFHHGDLVFKETGIEQNTMEKIVKEVIFLHHIISFPCLFIWLFIQVLNPPSAGTKNRYTLFHRCGLRDKEHVRRNLAWF